MAATMSQDKATLAIRIRNGQSSSGEWKYKYTNISGIKDDFGTGANASSDLASAGAILATVTSLLVGTVDGLRVVQTSVLVNE